MGTVYTYVLKQCGPCYNETFAFGVTYLNVDCCTGTNCNGTDSLSMSKLSITVYLFLFVYYIFRMYKWIKKFANKSCEKQYNNE